MSDNISIIPRNSELGRLLQYWTNPQSDYQRYSPADIMNSYIPMPTLAKTPNKAYFTFADQKDDIYNPPNKSLINEYRLNNKIANGAKNYNANEAKYIAQLINDIRMVERLRPKTKNHELIDDVNERYYDKVPESMHKKYDRDTLRFADSEDKFNKATKKKDYWYVPPEFYKTVMWKESTFHPTDPIDPNNLDGLMQVTSDTREILKNKYGFKFGDGKTYPDQTDPILNISAGIRWLSHKQYEEGNPYFFKGQDSEIDKLRTLYELFNGWQGGKNKQADVIKNRLIRNYPQLSSDSYQR